MSRSMKVLSKSPSIVSSFSVTKKGIVLFTHLGSHILKQLRPYSFSEYRVNPDLFPDQSLQVLDLVFQQRDNLIEDYRLN